MASITPAQFMDIIVLHELAHYNGAIGNPDKPAVERKLWTTASSKTGRAPVGYKSRRDSSGLLLVGRARRLSNGLRPEAIVAVVEKTGRVVEQGPTSSRRKILRPRHRTSDREGGLKWDVQPG